MLGACKKPLSRGQKPLSSTCMSRSICSKCCSVQQRRAAMSHAEKAVNRTHDLIERKPG